MATLIPNMFSSYSFSQKEELIGSIFSILQLQSLQHHMSQIAVEKSLLILDPEKPLLFMQQEAFMKGKIELITYLIENSAAATEQLNSPDLPDEIFSEAI